MALMTEARRKTPKLDRINIDSLQSMKRYLKNSNIFFEIVEDTFCCVTKGMVSLKMLHHKDYIMVTNKLKNKEYVFNTDSIPKEYHYLYWLLFKMVQRLRKKSIKYTIIRERELDSEDRVLCFVSLTDEYTLHFNNGSVVSLNINSNNSDIKFTKNKYKKTATKTIPFSYRSDTMSAIHHNDCYDTLRTIVHETIRCAQLVEKEKSKHSNQAKTWKIRWNADSGSVEDIKEGAYDADDDKYKYTKYKEEQEGLFKCNYQSDTSLSSDFNECNTEMAHIPMEKKENKSLSTVPDNSINSLNSIKSEASWRQSLQKEPEICSWTKQDVCCWLKNKNHSKDICMIFWNYEIDGMAMLKLTSDEIYQMFKTLESVTNHEKEQLIECINTFVAECC